MTMTRSQHVTQAQPAGPSVPPLEPGDRLTRAEFERRYNAMPDLKKAELIDGVVYMAAAVRARDHGDPHADVIGWLSQYRVLTPHVVVSDNTSDRLDEDNEPQPDAHLRITPKAGGSSSVDEDGYLTGPPELIVEVAASSVSYDLHDKLHVYRRHGVREYVVWRVRDEAIDWFILREGRYDRLEPDDDGLFASEVFPGLWLDPAALLAGNLKRVFACVAKGCETAEHAELVARLNAAAADK